MHRLFFRSLRLYSTAYLEALRFDNKRHTPISLKRLLFLTLLFPPFCILQIIHYLGFVFDDIFYSDYKDRSCNKLLFIIGIPRSGTTFIHRTIAGSQATTTFSTWEAIFAPAIIEKKCLKFLSQTDRLIGRPFGRLLDYSIRLFGDDFHNIHSVTLEAPEEDYLTLLPIGACLIVLFAFPNHSAFRRLIDFQSMPASDQHSILDFYKKNIQRHLYQKNENVLFVSKNAAFCTWLHELKSFFPDAKFILSIRDPQTATSSQLKALKSARSLFGTDPKGSLTKTIIQQSFDKNYSSIFDFLENTPKNMRILIHQEQLRADPAGILVKALGQLKINKPIQVRIPKTENKTASSKENAFPAQDPIDPSLRNTYNSIIELD